MSLVNQCFWGNHMSQVGQLDVLCGLPTPGNFLGSSSSVFFGPYASGGPARCFFCDSNSGLLRPYLARFRCTTSKCLLDMITMLAFTFH
ncbi:hypothetical protein AVEN_174080-1 [Araneus ventricosus]|uniref:Uncharacterized protein n=1 Tax=Araneus ventricosus TaxID=182803 RepID=A0A4Y2C1L0_ARAVE|nr:hypothetical protein AVEN_174080-1 [Araneus ventricosus]